MQYTIQKDVANVMVYIGAFGLSDGFAKQFLHSTFSKILYYGIALLVGMMLTVRFN